MEWQWSEWGDFLQGVGSVGQAAAIGFGAYYATKSFQSWRQQNVEGRRIELAERILTATYDMKTALAAMRKPGVSIQEANDLTKIVSNLPSHVNGPDWTLAYIVEARLNKYTDVYDRLNECRPMAHALFGSKAESAIETLCSIPTDIADAIEGIRVYKSADNPIYRMLKATLSSMEEKPGDNSTNRLILISVAQLETICLPIIRHDVKIIPPTLLDKLHSIFTRKKP